MFVTPKLLLGIPAAFLLSVCVAAAAQPVDVSNAWVRPTLPGQQATGAYMSLTAPKALTLVGVSTPAAGIAEVHEMKMDGDVMKMREMPALDLPAGKTVNFKPGGLHVMLMDLKQPFTKGNRVPMTLRFKDAAGAESTLNLVLPVAMSAPTSAAKKVAHEVSDDRK